MRFQSYLMQKQLVLETGLKTEWFCISLGCFQHFLLSNFPKNFHRRRKAFSKRLRRCCRQRLQFQQTQGEPDQLDLREAYLVAWVCHFIFCFSKTRKAKQKEGRSVGFC